MGLRREDEVLEAKRRVAMDSMRVELANIVVLFLSLQMLEGRRNRAR